MKPLITLIAAVTAVLLAACSPPKPPEAAPAAPEQAIVTEADVATRNALLTALTPVIETDLGQTVNFRVEIVRTQGPWGWVSGAPLTATGGPIDFSRTKYAGAVEHGVFDNAGFVHALLHQENGAWTVKTFVIGSTDVAWVDWPATYGAPPEVLGLETAEGGQ